MKLFDLVRVQRSTVYSYEDVYNTIRYKLDEACDIPKGTFINFVSQNRQYEKGEKKLAESRGTLRR